MSIDAETELALLALPRRYADAVTCPNADQFVSCFAPDGVWDPTPLWPERIDGGHDAIRAAFELAQSSLEWGAQIPWSTHIVSVEGDRARMRTYIGEWGAAKGETAVSIGMSVYHEECVKIDGVWVYALRDLQVIYYGSPDYANPMASMLPVRSKW